MIRNNFNKKSPFHLEKWAIKNKNYQTQQLWGV